MYTSNMRKTDLKEIIIGIIVLVCSTCLLLYKISDQYLWTDEVYSYEAAEMVLKTGSTTFPTGLEYPRASFYHHLLALSMKAFGQNAFSTNIVNIPFILGTMLIIYFALRDKNKLLGLSGSLLFLTSNFTIVIARETRMYSVTSFFLVLTAFAIYKGIIEVKKGIDIKIKDLKIRINLLWLVLALISFYLMYDTQPLTLLLGFGLVFFYIIMFFIERKKEYLIISAILIICAVIGLLFRYKTLNPIDLYFALSPDWAKNYPPAVPYYYFILYFNLPWCFLVTPITMYMIAKSKEKRNIYIFSLFFTMLFILSLLQAQAERYILPLVPLLITLSVLSIYDFYTYLKPLKPKTAKMFILLTTLLVLIPQSIFLTKELNEIDTYTKYSLDTNKKFEFNKLEKYLKENYKEGDYLIADFHSVYTLYWMDFDVDYFLLPDGDIHWSWGETDAYFGIPLMNYERDLVNFVNDAGEHGKTVYIVLREERKFNDIDEIFEKYKDTDFTRPVVYIIQ